MNRSRRPRLGVRLLIAVVVGLAVLVLDQGPLHNWLQRQEAQSLDWRFRVHGPVPPPADVVLVVIDEAMIDAAGGWPVSRSVWAELIRRLTTVEARTIVVDALFEPRSQPGDADLVAAMRAHGRVFLAVAVAPMGDGRLQLMAPAAPLAHAAAGLGHTVLGLGVDGRLGHLPPGLDVEHDTLPALALAAARAHGQDPGWPQDNTVLLRPYGPSGTIFTVTASDLVADAVVPSLAGALVVVAADAVAVGERFRTPFDASLSGGEALATAIANGLEARTLQPLKAALPLTLFVAAFGASLLMGRWPAPVSLALLALLTAGLLAAAQALFVLHDLWLPLAAPLLALALAAVAVEASRLVLVQRAERVLAIERQNLQRFFAPPVAARIAAMGEVGELDRQVEATVMFVDLVGFSTYSERVEPAVAMATLRRILAQVEAAIFAEGGTLVTFLGDGCLACFGVPEPAADAPARAMAAARRISAAPDGELAISIGLHHGPLVMGNGGGARQFQFTVIGDTVNVTSRIEALSRPLDATIVASSAVVDRVRDQAPALLEGFVEAPPSSLRGRTGHIDLYVLPKQGSQGPGGS